MSTPIEAETSITTVISTVVNPQPSPAEPEKKCVCSSDFLPLPQQFCTALVIVMALAVSWVASTQLAQATYVTGSFEAPFLLMYFSTSWLILHYPVYMIAMYAANKGEYSVQQIFRESVLIYKPYDFRMGHFIGKSALFCVLWTVAQYCYFRALDPMLLDATDVSALYATNFSFTYMLSWIILFEKFIALRIVAVIFSITGIVLFVYADGFSTPSMWGVALSVGASSCASVFKVLFKKFIGDISYGQLSFFMSIIGTCSLVCLWPIVLILYFTGTETVTHNVPWNFFCGSAAVLFVFHLLTHYTERVTHECVMGMGTMLGVPLCAVADHTWKNKPVHGMKISAVVIITVALMLLLIPHKYPERLSKFCSKCLQDDTPPPPHERHHRLRRNNAKVT